MSWTTRLLGTAVAIALALALSWLSRTPTSYANAGDALLRLSWRIAGTMVEECQLRTDEELEALAPHMRAPEVCSGRGADYLLRVVIGGATVANDTITPAGARRDRPVYVFREFELAPGTHEVDVDFRALVPRSFDPGDRPLVHAWDGSVFIEPTGIALITLDEAASGLVLRDP